MDESDLNKILATIEKMKDAGELLSKKSYTIYSTNNYIYDVINYAKLLNDENKELIRTVSMKLIIENSPYDLLNGFLKIEEGILKHENGNLDNYKTIKTINKEDKKKGKKEEIIDNINKEKGKREIKKEEEVKQQKKIEEKKKEEEEKSRIIKEIGGITFSFLNSDKENSNKGDNLLICTDTKIIDTKIETIHKNIVKNEFNDVVTDVKYVVTDVKGDESSVLLYHDNLFIHGNKDMTMYKMFVDITNVDEKQIENISKKCIDMIYYYSKTDDKFKPKKMRMFLFDIDNAKKIATAEHIISGILLGINDIIAITKNTNIMKDVLHEIEFAYYSDDIFYKAYKGNFVGGSLPCIELYEFILDGYGIIDSNPSQFNELYDAEKNECGKIKTVHKSESYESLFTNFDKEIISCDFINSEQSGGEFLNINELYKQYLTLNTKSAWITKSYEAPITKEIMEYINRAQKINFDLLKTYCKDAMPDFNTMHDGAFIMGMNVNNNDKIILFGDFHGSYHTFFRHMIRLAKFGIINLHDYKITDGYKIIFLGDVVDRGEYGLEIVQFICKMICANNDNTIIKIVYVRGNHEQDSMYINDFGIEVKKKIKDVEMNDFKDFFSSCSSAIILLNKSENSNKDKKFWLCHGGIPINLDIDLPIIDNGLCNIKFYNKIDTGDGIYDIPQQIRWNDFYDEPDLIDIDKTLHSGNGYRITPLDLKNFMKKHGINFIIRGHQDLPLNSFLYSSHIYEKNKFGTGYSLRYRYPICFKDNNSEFTNIIKNDNIYEKTNSVFGPIARLICDEKWIDYNNFGISNNNNTVYPVLTISTNTDMERPLYKDSFAILKFNLHEKRKSKFDEFINTLDNRKYDIKTMEDINLALTNDDKDAIVTDKEIIENSKKEQSDSNLGKGNIKKVIDDML